MRGCLSFVVFAAVLVGGLVWFALPPVADVLATQAAGLVVEGRITAHVESSFPPRLLTFHADAVTIHGADLRSRGSGIQAAGMDLRLKDVDLLSRRAASVAGTLTDVTIPAAASATGVLALPRIDLNGPTAHIAATATLSSEAVRGLVSAAATRVIGRAPDAVTLVAPDRIRVRIGSVTVEGRLEVASGRLVAALDRPAMDLTLVGPDELGPLALDRATVVGGDLLLVGTLDPSALGLSSGPP